MSKILVYTFFSYSKVTSKGLYKFEDDEYKFDKLFVSNRFATQKLLEKISDYDVVIGIADHNKNATKSRFDPKYVNKYSKRDILQDSSEFFSSNLNIDLPDNFYTFTGVTNGPCNRSGYLIMNRILDSNLRTKFGFFHLCKRTWENDLKTIVSKVN